MMEQEYSVDRNNGSTIAASCFGDATSVAFTAGAWSKRPLGMEGLFRLSQREPLSIG